MTVNSQVTANTITINGENNTASSQTVSGPTHAATAPPTFSLPAGTYTMPQHTTLACTGTGCTITWCFHSGSTSCTPGTSYASSIYLCPASPSACPTTGQATTICAFATVSGVNSTTPCNTYTTGNPNLATGDGRGVQVEPSMPLTTSCTLLAATLYLVVREADQTEYAPLMRMVLTWLLGDLTWTR